jgi:CO/xanthine dehydrogenase Mo-binding subunit
MEEQFYTITNHSATVRIKSGVQRDGRLTSRHCEIWWNGGAYADIGPRITQKSGFTAAGPYSIEHVPIDSYAIYTNLPPAGAMRGFGVPQLVWAYESHTDIVARALGIDPLAFRQLNALQEGQEHATGTVMRDAAIPQVLTDLGERMKWQQPLVRSEGTIRRGRGIAIGIKASISPTTSVAMLNVSADGSATLYCNTIDMGQGSDTAMSQIAADTLGIPMQRIKVVCADTAVTPFDMGTLGSRSTFHMGHAVRLAGEDARVQLQAMAKALEMPSDTPIGELFRRKHGMSAGNVIGVGNYTSSYEPVNPATGMSRNITPYWMTGGTGVEVEVDTETGHVRVSRLVSVADAGKVINPGIIATQLSGAAIMALGGTMTEEMQFSQGELTNGSLAYYKIPGMHDIPQVIENVIVESVQNSGPFGAKGVGESASFGVAAAIANAIEDAIGVRLTALPLTPETVFRALRKVEGRPLAED